MEKTKNDIGNKLDRLENLKIKENVVLQGLLIDTDTLRKR